MLLVMQPPLQQSVASTDLGVQVTYNPVSVLKKERLIYTKVIKQETHPESVE